MNEALKQRLLNEAVRIGDELLRRAERDENGLFWKTMSLNTESGRRQIDWLASTSIYAGVSGIALFLLELYEQTKAEKYLQAALSGMNWVEQYCHDNPTDFYAFYTGRLGVAYAMLRTAEVTGDRCYLQEALDIARPCLSFLNYEHRIDDLLNGLSGALLALIHLHAATGEVWTLEAADQLIYHLLTRAHYGLEGLYWDRNGQQIRGLCGFSHGAAGVGFVFLELAHYFQNDAFLWPAEQAFLYESRYFDAGQKNWGDFRKGIYTTGNYEKHERAFLAGDMAFFTEPGYMNAWCHGAVGIGLSRLRAFALTGKELYAAEVQAAVERNAAADLEPIHSFNLCHGLGGNAELFIEAYRTFHDETYLQPAVKTAETALALRQKGEIYLSGYQVEGVNEEDNSLLMGSAGVGYFYLRLAAPDQVPSILSPQVASVCTADTSTMTYINLSPAAVRKIVMEKGFGRTLYILEKQEPEKEKAILDQLAALDNRSAFKEAFIDLVQTAVETQPIDYQQRLLDVFSLERVKLKLDEAVPSWAWLHIKESVQKEQAKRLATLNEEALMGLRLVLDSWITIKLTAWRWALAAPDEWLNNPAVQPQPYPVILKAGAAGVEEIELAPFTYEILNAFQTGRCVESVVRETAAGFGIDAADLETELKVKQLSLQQIREAIYAGILVEA